MKRIRILIVLALLVDYFNAWAKINLHPTGVLQEALNAVDNYEWIKARELANVVLKKDPNNFIAQYVMVKVFHRADADLPLAYKIAKDLEHRLLKEYRDRLDNKDVVEWLNKILLEEIWLLNEMDKNQEELKKIDEYEDFFGENPEVDILRVWPYIKLRQYNKAIDLAMMYRSAKKLDTQLRAYNGLLVAYFEQGMLDKSIEVGLEALERLPVKSQVIAANMAEAALNNMEYDKVEKFVNIADNTTYVDCPDSPDTYLVSLYEIEGRFSLALSAFKRVMTADLTPTELVQFETAHRQLFAELLYAMGKWKMALNRIEMVYNAPDRHGMSSMADWKRDIVTDLIYWSILDSAIEGFEEKRGVRPFFKGLKYLYKEAILRYKKWELAREISGILSNPEHMNEFFNLNIPDDINNWLFGNLLRIVGSGVVLDAIGRHFKELRPQFKKVYRALQVEAAFVNHDWNRVLSDAPDAMYNLPNEEVLYRMKLMAMRYEAARRTNNTSIMLNELGVVLDKFPSVLRMLHLKIPVEFAQTDSKFAHKVAKLLKKSPRLLVSQEAPFSIMITDDGRFLKVCLMETGGSIYTCSVTQYIKGTDKEAIKAADDFHDQVFSPKLDMSQEDLNSLDGSPGAGSVDQILKHK